jgi:hypothetical protein
MRVRTDIRAGQIAIAHAVSIGNVFVGNAVNAPSNVVATGTAATAIGNINSGAQAGAVSGVGSVDFS